MENRIPKFNSEFVDFMRVYNFISMWERIYGENFFDYHYNLIPRNYKDKYRFDTDSLIRDFGIKYIENFKHDNSFENVYAQIDDMELFKTNSCWEIRYLFMALFLINNYNTNLLYKQLFSIVHNEIIEISEEYEEDEDTIRYSLFVTMMNESLCKDEYNNLKTMYSIYAKKEHQITDDELEYILNKNKNKNS